MTLTTEIEVRNTKAKIARLEIQYKAAERREMGNPTARELVLSSLRRMINQMKEEVIRYERQMRQRNGAAAASAE